MRTEQRDLEARKRRRRGTVARPEDAARTRKSLISIPELADELGVKVSYVRRLVHERRVPYVKVGRLVRFDPVEVRAWLAEGRVDALW